MRVADSALIAFQADPLSRRKDSKEEMLSWYVLIEGSFQSSIEVSKPRAMCIGISRITSNVRCSGESAYGDSMTTNEAARGAVLEGFMVFGGVM